MDKWTPECTLMVILHLNTLHITQSHVEGGKIVSAYI